MDNGREVTCTIKFGKGYEDTWLVFRGRPSEIRDDLISSFGLDAEECEDLTLAEVALNATNQAHGMGNVGATLGGKAVSGRPAKAKATSSPPWQQAKDEAAKPAENPLFKAIDECTSVDALTKLWASNQAAFSADAELMGKYKEKGRSLR